MELNSSVRRHRSALLAAAVVVPLITCAVLSVFRDSITSAAAALAVVLVVVGFASTGDRVAGVVAALAGAAWFDFFLTAPYNTFAINNRDDIEVAVLLILVGVAMTEIALWGRRQQARASRREGYLDGILRVATLASERPTSPDALAAQVGAEIAAVLDIDGGRFVHGAVIDPRVPVLAHDGDLTRNGRHVDVMREGLPTDDEIALEVRHGGVTVGHFMLTASTRVARPSMEQRKVAVLLADQITTDESASH